MTNIQLSSRSDEWYTPSYIIDRVHQVIGLPDLDPASSKTANQTIKAKKYFTREDNALLKTHWADRPVSVFLNPPGGKLGNKSLTAMFWQKLMDLRAEGLLSEAIFMGFSLEHLAVTQSCTYSVGHFPIVIPAKRIRFVSPQGTFNSPTHSNVIAYIPGIENNTQAFKNVFGDLGIIMHPDQPAN
ncbi:MAG: DNA N-6-adenine-methyltransferase [Waterburya sp.]